MVQPYLTYFITENYIMVVGDNRNIFFLAPNTSDPLPSCLDGTKNPIISGNQARNPAMMKTPGDYVYNSRELYIVNCL